MPVTQKSPEQTEIKQLNQDLGRLQRQAIQSKIPVVILFEGADGAGKGSLLNRLLLSLDPRHFKVVATHSPSEEAKFRPHLWRFWKETPAKGRMTIYDRSWYRHLLDDRVDGFVLDDQVPEIVEEIKNFEKHLSDDGVVIIKIYLTITKKKQENRLKKLADNPATSWRVTDKDWRRHNSYDQYSVAVKDMIKMTSSEDAPWVKIDSTSLRSANEELLDLVITRLRSAIARKKAQSKALANPDLKWRKKNRHASPLDRADLSLTISSKKYPSKLKALQERLHELEHQLYVSRRPAVIAFEGWDAAGKGGAIRRLVTGMDPRGYEVIPIAAPSSLELSHHYMWRFWNEFPKGGHIGIFDRSWYGRVTVERLEGFCSEIEWKRAFDEINEMEKHWSNCGTTILKFYMHIDQDEQLRRFEARQNNPNKQWKITDEDWRNREKWDQYKIAVDDMIDLTDKPNAPWIIVEGNNKPHARIKVLETTVNALEQIL